MQDHGEAISPDRVVTEERTLALIGEADLMESSIEKHPHRSLDQENEDDPTADGDPEGGHRLSIIHPDPRGQEHAHRLRHGQASAHGGATCGAGVIRGTPGRTRTCGQQVRNLLLYPTELRGHMMRNKDRTSTERPYCHPERSRRMTGGC